MKHEPVIAESNRRLPVEADFARAKAAQAAGGSIAQVVVGAWLLTWGKPDFKDFPDWLNDQRG